MSTITDREPGRRLSPSTAPIGRREKLREQGRLARNYAERLREPVDLGWAFDDLDLYDELLREYGGTTLDDARVFEIGYGARPYRMRALHARGVDAGGVDAEVPVLAGSPRELLDAWRANGAERAAKSLVRRVLFDPRERRALTREHDKRGLTPRLDASRLLVSDAADVALTPGSVDLVFSEEVFQSVERASLDRIVPQMHDWLRPGGLALIRPTVFTGITGGVLQEWSLWTLAHPPARRQSAPWDHLRERAFRANTHVNGLTRADYRELFSEHFEIVEERVKFPDLGREHFTPEIAEELSAWPDEELFSNMVLFVLRRRD